MAIVTRKLKDDTLVLGGSDFSDRISNWTLNNETDDGETLYTYTSSFVEPADPSFNISITAYEDFSVGGITRYLWDHDGETVAYQIDHNPLIPGEHVRFTGEVLIKAPTVGGDVRTTAVTETTLVCTGEPTRTYP